MKMYVVRAEYKEDENSEIFGVWKKFEDAYEFARAQAKKVQEEILADEENNEFGEVGLYPSIDEYDKSVEIVVFAKWSVEEVKKIN